MALAREVVLVDYLRSPFSRSRPKDPARRVERVHAGDLSGNGRPARLVLVASAGLRVRAGPPAQVAQEFPALAQVPPALVGIAGHALDHPPEGRRPGVEARIKTLGPGLDLDG